MNELSNITLGTSSTLEQKNGVHYWWEKLKSLDNRWFCVPGSSGTLKDVSSNENGLFERGKIVIIKSKLKLKGGL